MNEMTADDSGRSIVTKNRLKVCVVIAFKDRHDVLGPCIDRLISQLGIDRGLLLVDDGSAVSLTQVDGMDARLQHEGVFYIRRLENRGVAYSRNEGLAWCREQGVELVLMTDSDCLVPESFINDHMDVHRRHPDAAIVGGAIDGRGESFWAHVDRMMTWFHSIPDKPEGTLEHPYTAPTANISFKMNLLGDIISFDGGIRTGEDTMLSRRVRAAGYRIHFSPKPKIIHQDREKFVDVLRHQYEFGRHHYFVLHADRGLGRIALHPAYRLAFFPAFLIVSPIYVMAGFLLNLRPWIGCKAPMLRASPAILAIWCIKAFAVLEMSIAPYRGRRD